MNPKPPNPGIEIPQPLDGGRGDPEGPGPAAPLQNTMTMRPLEATRAAPLHTAGRHATSPTYGDMPNWPRW